jgi:hypothetical protein
MSFFFAVLSVLLFCLVLTGPLFWLLLDRDYRERARSWPFVWLAGWVAAGVVMVMFTGVQPASAQGVACFGRDALLSGMQTKYKEVPVGGGLLSGGAAMVILAAPDGKAFSIIALLTTGQACLIATGEGLEISPPKNSSEKDS